jgi:hypothetical protein
MLVTSTSTITAVRSFCGRTLFFDLQENNKGIAKSMAISLV